VSCDELKLLVNLLIFMRIASKLLAILAPKKYFLLH